MPKKTAIVVLAACALIGLFAFFAPWRRPASLVSPEPAGEDVVDVAAAPTTDAEAPAPAAPTPTVVPVNQPPAASSTAGTSTPPVPGRTAILSGPIVARSENGLSLQGGKALWVVTFKPTTKFQTYDAAGTTLSPVPASQIVVGQKVRVIGVVAEDGTVVAATVTLGSPAPKPAA